MPTREQALAELGQVFEMIAAEYREKGASLPIDTTEIVHAWQAAEKAIFRQRTQVESRIGAGADG